MLELRHDVFCDEQGVPEREELDGRDREGMHLVAVADEQVLATCRLLFVGPTVQFSRLAVRTSARRHGIATALLTLADDEARAGGARRLVLHAQTYARSLYERRRLRAARAGVHGGRDRAHRDGEVPVASHARAPDRPADRPAGDHRRRAGRPARAAGSRADPAPRSTPRRSVRRRARGPDAARAVRGAPRRRRGRTRPAGACGWCRTCTRRSTRDAPEPPAARQPRPVLGRRRPAARTR